MFVYETGAIQLSFNCDDNLNCRSEFLDIYTRSCYYKKRTEITFKWCPMYRQCLIFTYHFQGKFLYNNVTYRDINLLIFRSEITIDFFNHNKSGKHKNKSCYNTCVQGGSAWILRCGSFDINPFFLPDFYKSLIFFFQVVKF